MKLSRHSLLAAVLMASGLVFTLLGDAFAQRATYRTVSGHGWGHGCPCPADCPEGTADPAVEDGMGEDVGDDTGEDLPEVADLTSDAAFASASQSAAPNAIGDSLYPGYNVSFFTGFTTFATIDPTGGRSFKATHNNSPVPQSRVFFNYNYFNNAFLATDGADVQEIDSHQYELGAEYAVWCDMASVEVRIPMSRAFNTDLDGSFPLETDTNFGNVQVALKAVLCQDACSTYTAGLGFDLPTADGITQTDGAGGPVVLDIENETVILSPYLAVLRSLNCCAYVQGYAQVALPLNENSVTSGADSDDISLPTVLYLDVSTGYWLTQDCCGNGIVAIGELHYTNALDDDSVDVGGNIVALGGYEYLNATIGATLVRDCWNVTPAFVLPLLDDTDRQFDYEIAVQVNRRF